MTHIGTPRLQRRFARRLIALPTDAGNQAAGRPTPCLRGDPNLWFSESPRDLELAKAQCRACPVKGECLAGALARGEPWGVWGGEIVKNGAVIPFKRPPGRPRKNPRAA